MYSALTSTLPNTLSEIDTWLSVGPISSQLASPLSKFPVEILDLLFEELRGLHEVLFFALACKATLLVGKPHILRATREYYAPWAGCRLISLGDDTRRITDLPPALLTPAESAELAQARLADLDEDEPCSLSDFVAVTYHRVFHLDWRMARLCAANRHTLAIRGWRTDGRAPADAERFAALYGDGRSSPYPKAGGGRRVLCNFTKGEYVRAEGLRAPDYANLAHALLARIGWSSSPEVGMVCADAFKPQLTAGAWAGDRFCIVTVGDGVGGMVEVGELPNPEEGLRWKDVTEEVDALLRHIWENNSGKWTAFSRS